MIMASGLESPQRADMTQGSFLKAMVQPLSQEDIQSLLVTDSLAEASLDPAKISYIHRCMSDQKGQQTALFIIPKYEGYVIRSDLF